MARRLKTDHLGYAVIGKTRTLIWDEDSHVTTSPFAIYDPKSRPQLGSTSGPRLTSNYDLRDISRNPKGRFRFLSGWMRPSLDEGYCEKIYQHFREFDRIYLVGGGVGRWSGVNNFMSYVESEHPEFAERIDYRCYFRLSDFPMSKIRKIFLSMADDQ